MNTFDYDVAIVGAGLAGSALAAGLADLPLRVALLEARPLSEGWPPCDAGVDAYDLRVSAITMASKRLLERLGAWPDIEARRLCAYTDMHVWDAEGTGNIHFNAAEVDQPQLGYIVENRLINAALVNGVRSGASVHCLSGTPVAALETENGKPVLALENGDRIRSSLLVAADGALSRVREWAGFQSREWDYGHKAIACTVETEKPHQATAWQRFLPKGPLAFLPLPSEDGKHYCSIVWSADTEWADELMALDNADFCRAIAEAFEGRLGDVLAVSQRLAFPLRQRHAVDYVQSGIVLVGDAAHSIHPLAGQGINLGFQDVQVLLEELERACDRGLDVDEAAVLQRYQRRRKGDNLAMMSAMEGFKRLFEQDALPLRWLRNAGMQMVDKAGPIKQQIMRRAMGL